ncbi:MAG TPA: discoidin domain-containing protein, partial [Polyangiales bacterium]|nr:discoidin domain-containing protein [Polyangiales bacterium]
FTELLSANPDALRVEGWSESDLARVRAVLAEQTFVDSAELERSRQIADAELCRGFVRALLEQAGTTSVARRAIVRAHLQRGWRTVAVVLLSAAVVFYASLAFLRVLRGPDLALGKPWSTSSTWAECHPEHLKCGNARTRIFFHTKRQTQPWFLLDLGSPTTFGRVEIDNRDDCCRDRALPLVVEVSDDGQNFRELARRTEPFDTWHATFPATQARFVRLRIDRRDFLHLSRVTVRRR